MYEPRRRNRNIGTAKAGHGKNSRLTIPDRWSDLSVYWERLKGFVAIKKSVNAQTITFLVEPVRSGYLHHCTIQDILKVMELLPVEHIKHIKLIILRQPTRKQALLAPVWGRLGYWSEIGRYAGPGVYLESQPADFVIDWPRSLTPDRQQELMRLEDAGFIIKRHSRGYKIHTTAQAIRACQLYRTLPHEVGHYVDYLNYREDLNWGEDDERFWKLYDAKSPREKEVFAHRYADEFRVTMSKKGIIPFTSELDSEIIRGDGLKPEWFR